MSQNIYIGPNIQKLGLIRNQVYLGGLPAQVRAAVAMYPEIEALIVPIDELSEAIKKSQTKGEHLHHIYTELMDKISK